MEKFQIPKVKEQVIPQLENLFKSTLFVSLLIGSFATAQLGVSKIDTYLSYSYEPAHLLVKWSFVFVLAVFNCMLLTGIGVLAHEGIHSVLFKSRFWNELCGGILSGLTVFLPFYANRDFHLTHHRYTHQPGLDPEETLHNHSFWYAFVMGGPIALSQHYKIVTINLLGLFTGKLNKFYRGLKDIFFVSLAAIFYFYFPVKIGISLSYTVFPTLMLVPFVYSFRALCDHYAFEPAKSSVAEKISNQKVNLEDEQLIYQCEQLQIDSWVILTNPLMNWLWSHINYQQVHHRYPYLSSRYLPAIYGATKEDQPYAIVKGYFQCLLNLRKMKYYSSSEEIKPYLLTESLQNSL